MLPVLYTFRRCPYAMRARFALLFCNIAFEHREILLKSKPQSLLDASPKGTVPVLVVQGSQSQVIDESIKIMHWAYSSAGISYSEDALLVARNDDYFKFWLDRYKYADRYSDQVMEISRSNAAEFIDELEKILANTRYLNGDDIGFMDFAIMPFVRQFSGVDPNWFKEQDWPHVQLWLVGLCESSLFGQVMTKYVQWEPKIG